MIRGIHHPSIHSPDLDRLIAFYTGVLGFEVVTRFEWTDSDIIDQVVDLKGSSARGAMLRTGNCYLEVFEYSKPQARPHQPLRACDYGITHICLDVTDIDQEYERLCEAGMKFNGPPADFGDLRATYGRDPDGNIVEIQETLPTQVFAMARLGRIGFD
jgi:catechol 2,3-dioxygenase-like lactoylglutathione lyase family enzyme